MLDMSSICVRHHNVTSSIGFRFGEQSWCFNTLLHHVWCESKAAHWNHFLLNFHQGSETVWAVIGVCFVLKSLSGSPLFREHSNRKFATQKYFKNKFWQDCKIRKKKKKNFVLSFPEMFLITIKKAADQGATCKIL